uniref:Uncharacterized protein n=1 Tax=Oryza punctata TaxID=4537 RepID=A0A0E0K9H5_ORYPU
MFDVSRSKPCLKLSFFRTSLQLARPVHNLVGEKTSEPNRGMTTNFYHSITIIIPFKCMIYKFEMY